MKNVMAISATLKYCSIAVSYEGKLYEIEEYIDAASNLVWLADSLIKLHRIDLQKIDEIIAASGPGSFTGARVAQSFAKGVALSVKIPVMSATYFDVIDNIVRHRFLNAIIIIKSEKNQIYYKVNDEIGISSPELLANKINNETVLMGDAIDAVMLYAKNKIIDTISVNDFRRAKYLLKS